MRWQGPLDAPTTSELACLGGKYQFCGRHTSFRHLGQVSRKIISPLGSGRKTDRLGLPGIGQQLQRMLAKCSCLRADDRSYNVDRIGAGLVGIGLIATAIVIAIGAPVVSLLTTFGVTLVVMLLFPCAWLCLARSRAGRCSDTGQEVYRRCRRPLIFRRSSS